MENVQAQGAKVISKNTITYNGNFFFYGQNAPIISVVFETAEFVIWLFCVIKQHCGTLLPFQGNYSGNIV
jgi:hypothetical protein